MSAPSHSHNIAATDHEPFRGIDSYRYADHPIFFGRDDEADELAGMIRRYRGVLLYGVSGCGKTSIINAKMTPEMSKRGWVVERLRVQPVAGQEFVLRRDDGQGNLLPSLIAAKELGNEAFSATELRKRLESLDGSGRPLLIIDQFEELVTLFDLAPKTREERDKALGLQAGILDVLFSLLRETVDLPVKLLFAFREDYLARLRMLIERVPELAQQSIHLEPILPDKLHDVITGPFRADLAFERPAFSESLVEALVTAFRETARGGPVNLTELQIVCLSLYRSDEPEEMLRDKGIKGVMESYLESALTGESPEIRRAATTLLTRLLTPANTRNVVSREDLIAQAEETHVPRNVVESALDRLVNKLRLVREELRGDTRLCEIVSEFLVPWIRKQKQRRQQESYRRRNFITLVAGVVCFIGMFWAYQWQRGKTEEINKKNLELQKTTEALEAKTEQLAEQETAIRELKATMEGVIRDKDRIIAELSSQRSSLEAGLRATQSELSTQENVQQQTLLAIGVNSTPARAPLRRAPSVQEAQATIQTVLDASTTSANPIQAVLGGHPGGVKQAVFSRDGRLVATAGADGRLTVWTTAGENRLDLALVGEAGAGVRRSLHTVAFSPDDRFVLAGGVGGEVNIVAIETKEISKIDTRQNAVTQVLFSEDGKLGALAGVDGVRLWTSDPSEGWRQPKQLQHWKLGMTESATTGAITTLAFDSESRHLAAGGDGHFAAVWSERDSWEPNPRFPGDNPADTRAPVRGLAFSKDGKTVGAGAGLKVLVWREGADMLRLLDEKNAGDGHTGAVWRVAFDPMSGSVLASIGADGRCLLWDVRDVANPKVLAEVATQIRGRLFALAWIGRHLALGGEDGWMEVWDTGDPDVPTRQFSTSAHSGPVWGLTFDESGDTLMSYSGMTGDPSGLPSAKGRAARWADLLSQTPGENVMLWNMKTIGALENGWQEKDDAMGAR